MRVETGDGWTMYQGDCLDVLPTLEAGSVDLVLADPPYGKTACKWDTVIPFAPMWDGIKHVVKRNAAVVLFGSQPFTSALVMSNPKWFRYEWIWDKVLLVGFLNAKFEPLGRHENILVFAEKRPLYFPQMVERTSKRIDGARPRIYGRDGASPYGVRAAVGGEYTHRYPTTIVASSNANQHDKLHPTQKPVALLEYLIRTYTNEGDTVLDFTMGSGSTGVACIQTGRRFIGIEIDSGYFDIAVARLRKAEEARQPALLTTEYDSGTGKGAA